MMRKDGSTLYGELSISLIRDRIKGITGFRGVGRDITERKQFEDCLRYLSLHDQELHHLKEIVSGMFQHRP